MVAKHIGLFDILLDTLSIIAIEFGSLVALLSLIFDKPFIWQPLKELNSNSDYKFSFLLYYK